MNHHYLAIVGEMVLRPLGSRDIESLRCWRNDNNNAKFLRPLPFITEEMQLQWFESYIKNQNEIAFAIDFQKELIGSVSIYGFTDCCFEYGKLMIGNGNQRGKGLGYQSVATAVHIGFITSMVERCICTVHESNVPGISIENRIGFKEHGIHDFVSGGHELEMQVSRNNFYTKNSWVRNIVVEVMKGE